MPTRCAVRSRAEAFAGLRAQIGEAKREASLLSRVQRVDTSRRAVLGIAYPAWDPPRVGEGTVRRQDVERYVDSFGTFMRPGTVDRLMQRFMANGRTMDVDHSRAPGAAYPVQSWIVRAGDPDWQGWQGSWVVEALVPGADVWERVERGRTGQRGGLSGYSIDVTTRFAEVEVDVEDIGVIKLGEFIDPEPIYLSLVELPATGETFQATRAGGPDDIHLVTDWRPGMADDHNPTSALAATTGTAQGDTDDENFLQRVLRVFRRDPGRFERELAMDRALRSLGDHFARIEPQAVATSIVDALNWHVWSVAWGDDGAGLDNQGKREALVRGFVDAADIAAIKLTTEAFAAQRAADPDGGLAATELLERAVQRVGKKIAKDRLAKIVAARDALNDVIADASEDGAQRGASTADGGESNGTLNTSGEPLNTSGEPSGTKRNTSGHGDERDAQRSRDQEEPVADNKEVLEALQAMRADVAALRADIDAVKVQRAQGAGDGAKSTPPEPAADQPDPVLEAIRSIQADVGGLKSDMASLRGAPAQRRGRDPEEIEEDDDPEEEAARAFELSGVKIAARGWGALDFI